MRRTNRPVRLVTLLFALGAALIASRSTASVPAWADLDPNVRSAALGGAAAALPTGSDSAALNPAFLGFLEGGEFSLMHNTWLGDSYLEHAALGGSFPHGFGGAVLYDLAELGSVQGTEAGSNGNVYETTLYHPHVTRFGGGLGKHWNAFGLGTSLQGLWESGFGVRQSYLLWSAGFSYFPEKSPVSAGFYMQGASGGGEISDGKWLEYHPALSLNLGKARSSSFLGTVEGSFGGNDPKGSLKTGAEYAYLSRYFLRCGYHWFNDGADMAGSRGFTAGLGWKTATTVIDYAYTSMGTLGVCNQISLKILFHTKNAATPAKPASSPVPTTVPTPMPTTAPTLAPTTEPTTVPTTVTPVFSPTVVPRPPQGSSSTAKKPEAAKTLPEGMRDLYERGVEAFKARKNEAAIGYLTKAVAVKDPKVKDFYYAEAYSTLGLIYQYRIKTVGHRETARKYYRKALAIDPSTASAKQGLKLLGPGENGAGQKHPGTAVSPQ